ncbi:hypothetical protein WOLCODRAFT_159541 [Wolfiporia cocos MD-104 SS10]|uniref:Uncharacterized protein n=1 Tax=Wolfiporia cocos (strain MD-104) TaxID=742152 RepID=A0A2H3J547_WOLCO|nr:hypothetical protein WOLCODRAFT_159541 [Wolfiporia cocos MD-104 SS10]
MGEAQQLDRVKAQQEESSDGHSAGIGDRYASILVAALLRSMAQEVSLSEEDTPVRAPTQLN